LKDLLLQDCVGRYHAPQTTVQTCPCLDLLPAWLFVNVLVLSSENIEVIVVEIDDVSWIARRNAKPLISISMTSA